MFIFQLIVNGPSGQHAPRLVMEASKPELLPFPTKMEAKGALVQEADPAISKAVQVRNTRDQSLSISTSQVRLGRFT